MKVSKLNHDFRFDIPCIGQRTIETCLASGVAVLAFEKGKTLLLEKAEVERLTRSKGISLITV